MAKPRKCTGCGHPTKGHQGKPGPDRQGAREEDLTTEKNLVEVQLRARLAGMEKTIQDLTQRGQGSTGPAPWEAAMTGTGHWAATAATTTTTFSPSATNVSFSTRERPDPQN